MKLAQKLVEVMKHVDNVPKNGFNEFHRYAFAQEADILKAVRGKLGELGVLMLTSVEGAGRQGEITEVTTLHTFVDAETGEKLEVKGYGQGKDSTDKGGPKAITSSVKYAITKNFLIPTGDDPEKDDPPPQNGKKKAATNGKPSANGHQEPPKEPAKEPPQKQQTRAPDASTPHQQQQIERLAKELGLNVQKDIMDRMELTWPPNKPNADRILRRLNEKKQQSARASAQ